VRSPRGMTAEASTTPAAAGAESRWLNVPLVSYCGVPGALSADAAKDIVPNCEPVPCETLGRAVQSVSQWTSDLAIMPVQNTLEGTLHENQDQLMGCDLHIVAECSLPVELCLVVLPGVKKENVRTVFSHPQAFAQCSSFLSHHLDAAVREAVFDTAFGAKRIAESRSKDTAAIASRKAAELYGLEVIEADIHDKERGQNMTRYIILSREPAEFDPSKEFKTSVMFTLEEGSGQLFKALSVFALRDMGVTKIESRPLRDNPILSKTEGDKQFNYIFYLDYIGHVSELKCKQAMRHCTWKESARLFVLPASLTLFVCFCFVTVQELTPFFKVLGSYPLTKTPGVQ